MCRGRIEADSRCRIILSPSKVIHRHQASLTRSVSNCFNSRFSVQPGFLHHETHLPTFRRPSQAHTRFSRPHENARRTCRHSRASCKRPRSSGRLSFRLRPRQRLSAAAVAQALRSRHQKKRERLTLYCNTNQLSYARLALIVPKKLVPNAAHRNRIRRLIREAFRLQQANLSGLDCVVRLTRPTGLNPVSLEEANQLLSRNAE